ncbi:ATP-binding protein [Patescibacteria group bacterium]
MSSRKDEQTRAELRELRQALEQAQEAIEQQQGFIDQLTAPPFIFGTVISLSHGPQDYLVPGTRVRVCADSKFDLYRGLTGTVRGPQKRGWVIVDLDQEVNGMDFQRFRVGLPSVSGGACDLEMADDTGNGPPPGYACISADSKMMQVVRPPDLPLNVGDTVSLHKETFQIIGVSQVESLGDITYVKEVMEGGKYAKIDCDGGVRVVMTGKCTELDKGDQVILDGSGNVILFNLGRDSDEHTFDQETGICWDDIGGLEQAKMELIDAFETPRKHPEIFARYNRATIAGVLLYGPPGNGKTMLGKATATAIAEAHGRTGSSGFLYVKGPEILTRWVGDSEAKIRQLFAAARQHKEREGFPAVIFIDEADAILQKRGSGISSDVNKTIVPMFLTEMDGLEDSGAIVFLATNRPDIIDPAVVRDGRIDRRILVGRPEPMAAKMIFEIYLNKVPLMDGVTVGGLSELGVNELFSPRRIISRMQLADGSHRDFTLGHTVSGAMVKNIVDNASQLAIRRDIATGVATGLSPEDLAQAVEIVYCEHQHTDHSDELQEFAVSIGLPVKGIQRRVQGGGR